MEHKTYLNLQLHWFRDYDHLSDFAKALRDLMYEVQIEDNNKPNPFEIDLCFFLEEMFHDRCRFIRKRDGMEEDNG